MSAKERYGTMPTNTVQKAQELDSRFRPWLASSHIFPWQTRLVGVHHPRGACGRGVVRDQPNILWHLGIVLTKPFWAKRKTCISAGFFLLLNHINTWRRFAPKLPVEA